MALAATAQLDVPSSANSRAPAFMRAVVGSMDDTEFKRWVELLEKRTGVVVPPERKQFLETNLRIRMRELSVGSFGEYYREHLSGRRGAVEWATLVDRLTVHETHFFRHMPSYDLIRNRVVPEFATRNRAGAGFHAWSVGCSTGEEAYSLAMALEHDFAEVKGRYHFGITASDVSQPAIAIGRRGRYAERCLAEIPEQYRMYCGPIRDGHFEIQSSIRQRVGFAQMNLLDVARQPLREIDLIFCQNVLIYFPRERREQIVNQLVSCLARGGYLLLGPGEMTGWNHPGLARVGGQRTLAYRRRAEELNP